MRWSNWPLRIMIWLWSICVEQNKQTLGLKGKQKDLKWASDLGRGRSLLQSEPSLEDGHTQLDRSAAAAWSRGCSDIFLHKNNVVNTVKWKEKLSIKSIKTQTCFQALALLTVSGGVLAAVSDTQWAGPQWGRQFVTAEFVGQVLLAWYLLDINCLKVSEPAVEEKPEKYLTFPETKVENCVFFCVFSPSTWAVPDRRAHQRRWAGTEECLEGS